MVAFASPGGKPVILVVGSVHIDTVADIAPENIEHHDAEGALTRSIGGAAFNIASNLKLAAVPAHVYLYTYLPKKSALTAIILDKIRRRRILSKHVKVSERLYQDPVAEGGFIALRNKSTGYTLRAATQAPIGQEDFLLSDRETRRLRRAIKKATLVVFDTNLHSHTLEKAVQIAKNAGKPIVVAVASDHKASRYCDCPHAHADCCLALAASSLELSAVLKKSLPAQNVDEFIAAAEASQTLPNHIRAEDVCNAAKSRNVICVAKSKQGGPGAYYIFSAPSVPGSGGEVTCLLPPQVLLNGTARGTRTGITDAVTAACVDVIARLRKPDPMSIALANPAHSEPLRATIRDYIDRVVNVKAAVPDAETDYGSSTIDSTRGVWRKLFDRSIGKVIEDWLTIVATVILTLLAAHWQTLVRVVRFGSSCLADQACRKQQWLDLLDYLKDLM